MSNDSETVVWSTDETLDVTRADGRRETLPVRYHPKHPRWGACWIVGEGVIAAVVQDDRAKSYLRHKVVAVAVYGSSFEQRVAEAIAARLGVSCAGARRP